MPRHAPVQFNIIMYHYKYVVLCNVNNLQKDQFWAGELL